MKNREMNQLKMDDGKVESAHLDDRLIMERLKQLSSLYVIRMLNPLIIACQQHRGASTALLQGNVSFRPRVEALQAEIYNRIHVLTTVNREYGFVIPEQAMEEIGHEWGALMQEWRTDTVITNFDFHSHFVEKLLGLMWGVAERSDCFLVSIDEIPPPASVLDMRSSPIALRQSIYSKSAMIKRSEHRAVATIIIRDIPELIETMAKVRGLASHASVMGCCDKDHQLRLGTLLLELNHQKERLIKSIRPLQHYMLSGIPALVDTLLHEHNLSRLPEMISREIVGRSKIDIDSQAVFSFVSEIIEIYYTVVEQGIILIQRNSERAIFSDSPVMN